jgi:Na+/H+ antiporter NhaD/arsenite permease-like protein
VSNIGGALTPLGDPPLFLGFLHGVPFFWTLHILPEMAFASVILLALYFVLDTYYYRKESKTAMPDDAPEPLRIEGKRNFIFLAGIIGAVLMSGTMNMGEVSVFGIHQTVEISPRTRFSSAWAFCRLQRPGAKSAAATSLPGRRFWSGLPFAGIFIPSFPRSRFSRRATKARWPG